MRRKRVLVVHDTLLGWGAERNLAHLGEFAPQEILEVSYLLTVARPTPAITTATGARVFFLKPPRLRVNRYSQAVNFALKLLCSLAWALRMRRKLGPFDYLIASNPEECVIAFVTKKALGLGRALLVFCQIPLDFAPASPYQKLALRAYLAIAKRSEAVLCLSHGLSEHLAVTHGVETTMFVLPSCLDLQQVDALSKERVDEAWLQDDQRRTIIFAGRLSNRQKRIDVLLQAVALLKSHGFTAFKVLLLGEGEDRSSLEQLAQSMDLEGDVYFLGFRSNPYQYFALSDVFVLSSDVEGFGNVIVEAMACGLPVIATDCHTGPSEILEGGKWGVLVPTANHTLLADEILRVLTDETLRLDLKRRSLTRARDFECAKVFQGFADVCEHVDGIGRVGSV